MESKDGYVNSAFAHRPSLASLYLDRPAHQPEPAPHIDYYRNPLSIHKASNLQRPTLYDLHQEIVLTPDELDAELGKQTNGKRNEGAADNQDRNRVKFGWIIGVLIRCVLNILGAILYLRLTWMAGQCGTGLATLMILISACVTTLTALSMCAICTNGEIRGGGAYFLLSRSLGPEFGGAMGIVFAMANALAVALHTTGFSETVRDVMKENGVKIIDGSTNDIRIISICTLCLLMAVVIIGLSVEVKAQMVLLVVLATSYVVYIVGTFLPPTDMQLARGITGYSWQTLTENFGPHFRGETFFTVFAVYFPASTGIMAGANISGDLKDPGRAIPKGTLLAILISSLMYTGAVWMSSASVIRDASGNLADTWEGTINSCTDNGTCPYGLMNYFQTMQMQSAFGPLIIAGIFAATLSSALACLVSGPKLFQAVGRDKLFPKIDWFAKGYGQNDEPRRAYLLGFFISFAMSCVGDLNTIAPFISNFYLATYAVINFACFHGSLAKSPGWRPAFKYYNRWLSCLGALLCIACMFLMSYTAAPLTFIFIAALYAYLSHWKPDVNWGSSNQAHQYVIALQSMTKLLRIEPHVKNYRPQILALVGHPASRPSLVDFVQGITRKDNLLILGHVLPRPAQESRWRSYENLRCLNSRVYDWLKKRHVKGFYAPVTAQNTREGLRMLLETSGMGKMRPNIVVLGFKNGWTECDVGEVEEYFGMLHECFHANMSVCVLRVREGLDYSSQMLEHNIEGSHILMNDMAPRQSSMCVLATSESAATIPSCNHDMSRIESKISTASMDTMDPCNGPAVQDKNGNTERDPKSAEVLSLMNQFRMKVKRGVIDIWWLFDDGGLALLIPHLLVTHKSYLRGSKLRIFSTANNASMVNEEQRSMVSLLAKFRINCTDVTLINNADHSPSDQTLAEFNQVIGPFKRSSENGSDDQSPYITDDELEALQDKTNRHLRTRELLLEHSKTSSLVVITLPIPRKNGVSACLYLAWLEMLTSFTQSPVLLVRGNQQSVLTFYS